MLSLGVIYADTNPGRPVFEGQEYARRGQGYSGKVSLNSGICSSRRINEPLVTYYRRPQGRSWCTSDRIRCASLSQINFDISHADTIYGILVATLQAQLHLVI